MLANACFDGGEVGTKIGDSSQGIAPAPLLIVNNGWRDMLRKYDHLHLSFAFICCLNELLTTSFPHSLDGTGYIYASSHNCESIITIIKKNVLKPEIDKKKFSFLLKVDTGFSSDTALRYVSRSIRIRKH